MGKSKKLKSNAGDLVSKSALPLDLQIERSKRESGRDVARVKQRRLKRANQDDDKYIDEALSSKILKTAWKQKQDIEAMGETKPETAMQKDALERMRKVSLGNDSLNSLSDDDIVSDHDDYDDAVLQINPEDEAAIEKFMSDATVPSRTLHDIITEKIEKKEAELELRSVCPEDDDFVIKQMDPAVVEMYREIGLVLSRYRSGKIPKAFKVLPKMMNWEQLLYLTNPDKWSAAAMYQATRIFASNLHSRMCQRFYNLILLPRLRDDIMEYKKLNFHLFQALHKAIYKPQAFFKGILLPLCESGTCTLREATIFGSVLAKASIPMMHAAVAMLKIANMEYTGSNSLFLRILIDKKYTLPYRAIDALVNHYLRFRKEERQLPVLWHQSLLAFAQRYKNDISDEQRVALLELTKVQNHYQITPEVCRELISAKKKESEIESASK
ncbi:Bystin [Onchocerca flexuosa]|uniref:Bystin n=1 Tax=Onchocerca flexuosa TaxID=387005 RepID=A0A238C2V1_9BILA|nr:Bystin [Onchocerca flexuosa]